VFHHGHSPFILLKKRTVDYVANIQTAPCIEDDGKPLLSLQQEVIMLKHVLTVCLLVIAVCGVARGDVIHTTDGRKITGKIVREDPDSVTIKARYGGEITIDKMDIERIERGKLPEEIYEDKDKALKDNDAEGHYKLGLWCRKNSLSAQAKKEFEKAITADSGHEGARKALGYLKKEGKWVLPSGEKEEGRAPTKKPGGISAAQLAKLTKLIGDAISKGKLTDSQKEKLKQFEGLSKKDFSKVEEKIKEWKTYKSQNQVDFTIQVAGKQTFMHLPPKYNPKKSYPLIIVLHGAGDNGQNLRGAWAKGDVDWSAKVRDTCIVAAPTWGPAQWWKWPEGNEVYALLDHMKSNYNVDTNRVMLTGFSNGGHSSWSLGMKQPSLFAGLAPSAGGPVGDEVRLDLELIVSLANLPVHWVHSADDRICPAESARRVKARYKQLGYDNLVHKQYDSGGHTAHRAYWGTIFKWFTKLERDMYPEKAVFLTDHQEIDTAYWVRLQGISGRAKVTGEIKGSTIKLKVEKVAKIIVFLSDNMVNLDKPVKVEINGKQKFSGTVKRSACTAVEEALRRNDRGAVYAAYLEFDVP
jgi:predicted esterase